MTSQDLNHTQRIVETSVLHGMLSTIAATQAIHNQRYNQAIAQVTKYLRNKRYQSLAEYADEYRDGLPWDTYFNELARINRLQLDESGNVIGLNDTTTVHECDFYVIRPNDTEVAAMHVPIARALRSCGYLFAHELGLRDVENNYYRADFVVAIPQMRAFVVMECKVALGGSRYEKAALQVELNVSACKLIAGGARVYPLLVYLEPHFSEAIYKISWSRPTMGLQSVIKMIENGASR